MSARIGRGMMVTLLLAAGCGSSGSATGSSTGGNQAGGATGAAGASAGAGGAPGSGGAGAGAGGGSGSGTAGTKGEGGVAGTTWLTPPPVPPALEPPAGATVKLHAHAEG